MARIGVQTLTKNWLEGFSQHQIPENVRLVKNWVININRHVKIYQSHQNETQLICYWGFISHGPHLTVYLDPEYDKYVSNVDNYLLVDKCVEKCEFVFQGVWSIKATLI